MAPEFLTSNLTYIRNYSMQRKDTGQKPKVRRKSKKIIGAKDSENIDN